MPHLVKVTNDGFTGPLTIAAMGVLAGSFFVFFYSEGNTAFSESLF